MSLKEIANLLLNAERPVEIFGDISKEEIKKKYRSLAKICHPDIAPENEKDLAERTIKLLNDFYHKALDEIEKGIYNITDEKEILKTNDVLFEFDLKGKNYKFYKYLYSEDICDVYEGISDDKVVTLKIVADEQDNDLVVNEYNVLKKLSHHSLPKLLSRVKINGKEALILEKGNEISIEDLKKEYGALDGSHVCWILERLLSIVGYLHSEKIVHGNIKEENILIDVENHNVILKDYTLCINNANDSNSKYKIINDDYTPNYVDKDSRVIPNADIYAVGKIAINLLGGDISRVAMPTSCDARIRTFIRKLLNSNENDAWKLWDELIKVREEVYGTKRFQKLEKKKVRRS